jgi:hypothetical protein
MPNVAKEAQQEFCQTPHRNRTALRELVWEWTKKTTGPTYYQKDSENRFHTANRNGEQALVEALEVL